jgi:Uma2 family endonuclease
MASAKPRAILEVAYEEAAQAYLRSLPPEHFMEATPQATQRKITWDSLDLLHARRPEVKVFNELLVQYPLPGQRQLGQVVPDNMVVLSDEPIQATTSFNMPLEPARPFWMLEYVSKHSKRKDYEDSFNKYERDLKVPYYLVFYPDVQELTLYRHTGRKYQAVPPNDQGHHPLPKLDLEVGLLDGWVRFWYQGQLLPLPPDLQRDLDEVRRQLKKEKRQKAKEKRRADEEKRRADEEKRRADEEKRRAEELIRRVASEAAARQAAERELAQLRADIAKRHSRVTDEAE